jgi:hypothetical protein
MIHYNHTRYNDLRQNNTTRRHNSQRQFQRFILLDFSAIMEALS